MTTTLERPATTDGLFLWIMHRFAEAFADHAILKGGIALRLIDCPRSTTDIDYVFVPYTSKKEVSPRVESLLREIEGAEINLRMHSTMMRAEVRVDEVSVQVEASVATECDGTPMSTGEFARRQGQPARIVRIMSLDWAFAHKLAAWNERRLVRDLYDCYFFAVRLRERPATQVLDRRLTRVTSRIPSMARRTTMTRADLASELRKASDELSQDQVRAELGGVLPPEELAGLTPRIKAAVARIAEWLEEE